MRETGNPRRRVAHAALAGVWWVAALLGAALAGRAQSPATPASPPAAMLGIADSGPALQSPVTAAPGATGSISGVVTDTDGELILGAEVTLSGSGKPRTSSTGPDGRFTFSGVPPGTFHLVVNASGRGADNISGKLAPGESFDAATLVLHAAADVSIEVLSPHAVAEVEVKTEEHQRVLGFAPNFYVAYDFRAPALDARQKWELNWRTVIDPVNVALLAGQAGVEQATNTYAFGSGPAAYGKRFGAAYADLAIGNSLGGWILPIVFKQDPRYFYMGTGSKRHRFFYALSTAVIARGDNGKWQPAYASILGGFGAGAASNLYYPAVNRQGASLTIENGLLGIGIDAIGNVVQEFVLKHVTPGTKKP